MIFGFSISLSLDLVLYAIPGVGRHSIVGSSWVGLISIAWCSGSLGVCRMVSSSSARLPEHVMDVSLVGLSFRIVLWSLLLRL